MTENKINQLLCYLVNNIIDLTYYSYNNINIKHLLKKKLSILMKYKIFNF